MKILNTFLLSFIFLVLFIGSSVSFADSFEEGLNAYVKDDYNTAVKLLKPLADQGDGDAQFLLGTMYQYGQGVTQDYKEAVKWYRLSADQGKTGAQAYLGVMYYNGQGVTQDYKESVRWLRLSSEQGSSLAQAILGVAYAKGQGVLQDYVLAHMWFNLSSAQGDKDSMKNRSRMEKKMSPSQIEKAQEMAREWMEKHR